MALTALAIRRLKVRIEGRNERRRNHVRTIADTTGWIKNGRGSTALRANPGREAPRNPEINALYKKLTGPDPMPPR
jgi:hypothetical protein